MRTLDDLSGLKHEHRPLALAIGFFDGLHRGHRRLLARAREISEARGGTCWALTFEPHPARILHPASAPSLLTSLPEKLALMRACGLAGCVVMPFSAATAVIEAEAFVTALADNCPALTDVVVGRNWRFGRHRRGTVRLLARLLRTRHVDVTAVRPALRHGLPISSTRIRQAVRAGRIEEASAMLEYPYEISGKVISGRRIGRKLGYPTANLACTSELLPPYGIYAARGVIDGRRHDGVVSYGIRPTFQVEGDSTAVMELHCFEPQPSLYGKTVSIQFIGRIRDEWTFPSAEALRQQIADDVISARNLLARWPVTGPALQ